MESILYQIFSGEYDITPKQDETQQQLRTQLFMELDKVEAVFGTEFFDRLFALHGEWKQQKSFQYYRSGFLLGARLMLAALG
ncbi:hypothetical protein [Flintibacter muris]|uniref:hypothetical protein n=1 Tax=Flintibacter muris TaxID=2941327 RepID=UPI00203BEEE8|nr:hypothetical protein [Flintibacter muris]